MADLFKFSVGGPVQIRDGTYLERSADKELFEACKLGQFAYVLACRQIGKSSLMVSTAKKLNKADIRIAMVDLNGVGRANDAGVWYFSLIDILARELSLDIDVESWWDTKSRLTLNQLFLQFLQDIVLMEITEPIVIFIDEIDATLGFDFTDDFFASIRAFYNNRSQHEAFRRLTFVLLGVATPDELIADHNRTPFNIGQAIALNDFTKIECQPLYEAVIAKFLKHGSLYFDQIYDWTNGHPYLTQKLCNELFRAPDEDDPRLVDTLVKQLFLAPKVQTDSNLGFVENRVIYDSRAREMLKIYHRVLQNETVYDDERSISINRLKLYGLVISINDVLKPRNKIYTHAFDETWIQNTLTILKEKRERERAKLPKALADKYRGHSRLTEEEYASIYLAEDLRRLEGKTLFLALKILKLHISTNRSIAEEIERYQQFSQIHSSNLINIFEVGSVDDQSLYIAMEYISSESLRKRLETGPLPLDTAMEIAGQIGDALETLHNAGVIHCDVNPNNILLDAMEEPIKAVLTDFDVAKFVWENDNSSDATEPIRGTIRYMAPEQLTHGSVTTATDIYALAITFFEMVVGRPPFEDEIINQHLTTPLPKLSEVVPKFGYFFDKTLAKATNKNPDERYQSASEFIRDLKAAYKLQERSKVRADNDLKQAKEEMQQDDYDALFVSALIDRSLKEYPNYLPALELRGRFLFEQKEFVAALKAYQQVYKQTSNPTSALIEHYLNTLEEVAKTAMYTEAITHYETIIQVLDKFPDQDAIAARREQVRTQLINLYVTQGDEAYANRDSDTLDNLITALITLGANSVRKTLVSKRTFLQIRAEYNKANAHYNLHHTSENIDELTKTIQAITDSIAAIEPLQSELQEPEASTAEEIMAELHLRLDRLAIRRWEEIIKRAEVAIEEIRITNKTNPEIFEHYEKIDEAYQEMLRLIPQNSQVTDMRYTALKEHAKYRLDFAQKAEDKGEDQEALEHYRALRRFDDNIVQTLASKLDVAAKIEHLEDLVELGDKYTEITRLIDETNYSEALDRVFSDFIHSGQYKYRDVAKLFSDLVYIQQDRGQYPPPEWEELFQQDKLTKLQQKKKVIIYRNIFISIGLILSLMLNLLFGFLFRDQINNLTKGLIIYSIIIFGLAGILILYQRISQ